MHCNGQICDNFLPSVNRQYTVHWRAVTANWETGNASEFQLQMASSRLAGFLPAATSVKNRTDSPSIVTKFVRKSLSEKNVSLADRGCSSAFSFERPRSRVASSADQVAIPKEHSMPQFSLQSENEQQTKIFLLCFTSLDRKIES